MLIGHELAAFSTQKSYYTTVKGEKEGGVVYRGGKKEKREKREKRKVLIIHYNLR